LHWPSEHAIISEIPRFLEIPKCVICLHGDSTCTGDA
jgi:hypothetical protein